MTPKPLRNVGLLGFDWGGGGVRDLGFIRETTSFQYPSLKEDTLITYSRDPLR